MDDFSFYTLGELLTPEEKFNWHQIVRMTPRTAHHYHLRKLPE